ncbi:MAG: hypothetical protein ACWIPJ_06030, partial [Polaribacter sp.]
MQKLIVKTTTVLYILLAAFPLMKPNINSIFIIFCVLFAIFDFVKEKRKIVFSKELFLVTLLFWMFLFHEIISLEFKATQILLSLPFLIFPLLFLFKPEYINEEVKKKSIIVFQGSVMLQSIIYLIVFLKENELRQIFEINNYNIPFFRDFVTENASVPIHPTYFSAFLLVSFTLSLFSFRNCDRIKKGLNLFNIVFTTFFI